VIKNPMVCLSAFNLEYQNAINWGFNKELFALEIKKNIAYVKTNPMFNIFTNSELKVIEFEIDVMIEEFLKFNVSFDTPIRTIHLSEIRKLFKTRGSMFTFYELSRMTIKFLGLLAWISPNDMMKKLGMYLLSIKK
jgi:hypothetical protein